MSDNVETMAYAGQTPWHGKGTIIMPDDDLPTIQAKAGLDWKVKTAALSFKNGKITCRVPGRRAMFREDTGELLDVCGPKYVPFQNDEILGFFRDFVEAGEMEIETVGHLVANRQHSVWALARMNQSFNLGTNDQPDENKGYVLLMNPHEYGKGMIAKLTLIRVVCWNTMQMALGQKGNSIKIWHNREFDEDLAEDAKERLGIAREKFEELEANAHLLAQIEVEEKDVLKIIAHHFGSTIKLDWKEIEDAEQLSRAGSRVYALFNGEAMGADLATAKGTAWGLLNAGTQYLDHEYGKSAESRLHRAWRGSAGVTKVNMMADLLALGA